jgi:hypothetical protein
MARHIHVASHIPAALVTPTAVARNSRIGAMRNAVTPRSSSIRAKARWIRADRSENPATNSAGDSGVKEGHLATAASART